MRNPIANRISKAVTMAVILTLFQIGILAAGENDTEEMQTQQYRSIAGTVRLADGETIVFSAGMGQPFSLVNRDLGLDFTIWPETIDNTTGLISLALLEDADYIYSKHQFSDEEISQEATIHQVNLGQEIAIHSSAMISFTSFTQGLPPNGGELIMSPCEDHDERFSEKADYCRTWLVNWYYCCAECGSTTACGCAVCLPNCGASGNCACCTLGCYCSIC